MSDQVNLLKQVKVPIWARMLGWYRARQRRKEAYKEISFIATVYAWTFWSDKTINHQWYICKQDGAGRRFYEYGYNSSLLSHKEKLSSTYASIIAPWLVGGLTNQYLIDYAQKSIKQPERSS